MSCHRTLRPLSAPLDRRRFPHVSLQRPYYQGLGRRQGNAQDIVAKKIPDRTPRRKRTSREEVAKVRQETMTGPWNWSAEIRPSARTLRKR